MDITVIKDWLVPVSSSFALVVSALGARIALKELGVKLAAEARLKYSSQVEADIQLLKVFTEIMALAHGRGPDHVSDKAVEFLLKDKTLAELTKDGRKLSDVIRDAAVLSLPVGGAAQDAAIAAIATLGKRHEILRDAAIQALESLATFKKDIAEKQLARLRGENGISTLLGAGGGGGVAAQVVPAAPAAARPCPPATAAPPPLP